MSDPARWCLSPGVDLQWRQWDSEFIAYERFSGNLHCFDQATAVLLQRLAQGPCDVAGLDGALAAALALEADTESRGFVEQALRRLSRLELVERGDVTAS